ncbi:hypothetical protein BUALT_Bualt04G0099100 [Buddleja alternifolia]|uniref:Uncharacterized protein n=1 Tax=Buddleja alternifolia TaxID=168488 RepID=A0AAV6XYX3_9LAMI|nr:hypothetical protein BUALT_Bualt04G0099100 [Buddleja alternifolia]
MVSKRAPKQSLLIRFIRSPIWILTQVRDLYVQSLTGAGHVSYGNSMGCPTPHIPSLPRSTSVNLSNSNYGTTEAELRDLIRAASTRGGGARAELFRSKSTPLGGGGGGPPVPRSNTVGFGRIDEDKPFEYEEDDVGLLRGGGGYPRSRSYAVSRRIKAV